MKLKSVKKIRDEWCDSEDGKLSKESLNELKKHLESNNTDNLCEAMSLVTDARIMEYVPLIEKLLTNEWSIVREFAIGKLLGLLKIPAYAEIGLKMAQEDEDSGVRCLAATNLGHILDLADSKLKKKIASYMYNVMIQNNYDERTKQNIYQSVMIAVDVPWKERPSIVLGKPDLQKMVNPTIVQKFKEKYGL